MLSYLNNYVCLDDKKYYSYHNKRNIGKSRQGSAQDNKKPWR